MDQRRKYAYNGETEKKYTFFCLCRINILILNVVLTSNIA